MIEDTAKFRQELKHRLSQIDPNNIDPDEIRKISADLFLLLTQMAKNLRIDIEETTCPERETFNRISYVNHGLKLFFVLERVLIKHGFIAEDEFELEFDWPQLRENLEPVIRWQQKVKANKPKSSERFNHEGQNGIKGKSDEGFESDF